MVGDAKTAKCSDKAAKYMATPKITIEKYHVNKLIKCFLAIAFLLGAFVMYYSTSVAAMGACPGGRKTERKFEVIGPPPIQFVNPKKADFRHYSAITKELSKGESFPITNCSDSQGICTWERTFGGALADKAYDIAALADGGVVVVGHTRALKGIGHDALIVRADRKGKILWSRSHGGLNEDHAYGVVTSRKGDIVVAGYTRSKGVGKNDLWVFQVNMDGFIIWEHTFGANGEDGIFQIKVASDESIMATGYSDLGGSAGYEGFWLLRLDARGNF